MNNVISGNVKVNGREYNYSLEKGPGSVSATWEKKEPGLWDRLMSCFGLC